MGDEVPAPKSAGSKLPSGVDRSLLLLSLKLSPRERFEQAVRGGRVLIWLRRAKRVSPPAP